MPSGIPRCMGDPILTFPLQGKRQRLSVENRLVTTIDELRTLVGQELGHGGWFEITQGQVDLFAELTGDLQWIHVDPERAEDGPFGGTIAHGFLTLAIRNLLQQDWQGTRVDLQPRMALNYGLNRVRFMSPVRVGKRVRLRTRLLEVQDIEPQVYHILLEFTVEIEGESKPAMVAEKIDRMLF